MRRQEVRLLVDNLKKHFKIVLLSFSNNIIRVFAMPPIPSLFFSARVREIMTQRGLSSAVLAMRAGLTPSLLSRLTTENLSTRRDPQIEHILALARGLEVSPAELVAGTEAEPILGQWIPRDEFEKEVQARNQAQAEASELRTELAGTRSELTTLRNELEQIGQEVTKASQRAAEAEASARRELPALRAAKGAAEAKLAQAMVERDQALADAQQNYRAWANAHSQALNLQRQVAKADGKAVILGVVGAAIGAMVAGDENATKKGRR